MSSAQDLQLARLNEARELLICAESDYKISPSASNAAVLKKAKASEEDAAAAMAIAQAEQQLIKAWMCGGSMAQEIAYNRVSNARDYLKVVRVAQSGDRQKIEAQLEIENGCLTKIEQKLRGHGLKQIETPNLQAAQDRIKRLKEALEECSQPQNS